MEVDFTWQRNGIIAYMGTKAMVTIEITLDTQVFAKDEFDALSDGGMLISTSGIVNHQWDEFSAIEAAVQFGLNDVRWEHTWDDTPGSLTCLIGYPFHTKNEILQRLNHLCGIDQYEIYGLVWPFSGGN